MRILIVEDDFTSRQLLKMLLSQYGDCDIAVDGEEAVSAFKMSLEEEKHYDLICLDIMMPKMDGHEALKAIRDIEDDRAFSSAEKAKIIMTTALDTSKDILGSFKNQCDAYIVKPIEKEKFTKTLKDIGLM